MEQMINGHTKKEAIELAFKLGFESEKNRMSCSQSAFHAITAVLGYRNPQVFQSLGPLEGGGADSGLGSCGAFCGPLLAFGLFFGRGYDRWEKGEMDLKAAVLGEKLLDKFQQAYGSVICKDIQTHCLGFATRFVKNGKPDMQAFEKFERHGGHQFVAPTVVGRAASWAVEILWDELPKDADVEHIPAREAAEEKLTESKPR